MSETIKIDKDQGIFYFQQGNVRFPVDSDRETGMVKSCQVLDKLNRGTWLALGQLNGFTIKPFNEVMLKPLLIGVVQLAWFRRFRSDDPLLEKLESNQAARVAKYAEDLAKVKEQPEKKAKAPGSTPSKPRQAQVYAIVAGADVASHKGQLRLIIDAMLELKRPVAVVDVVAKISGQLKTRQPAKRVVGYYFSQGQKDGLFCVVAAEDVAKETERLEQVVQPKVAAEEPPAQEGKTTNEPPPATDKKPAAKKGHGKKK